MNLAFINVLISIIIINIVLSGDNAVVIALATLRLNKKQAKTAIFWGTFGAVALRIVLTIIAAYVLSIPYIQTLGGIALTWIAVKLLQNDENANFEAPQSMMQAIKTIIIADLFMSLDNVLAVAGASGGNDFLLIFGLVLSIPLVVWGSTFIAKLMSRWSWLVYIGAGLIGWVAGEMFVKEPYMEALKGVPFLEYLIPGLFTLGVISVGFLKKKQSIKKASI